MDNNDIFKKLRVALQLRDDQIVEILELVDFRISKGEIGNIFRNPEHEKYMECGDQVLRNFLNGLVIHLRGTKEEPKNPKEVLTQIKSEIHKTKTEAVPYEKKAAPEKKEFKKAKKPFAKEKKINPLGNVKFNNGKPHKKKND